MPDIFLYQGEANPNDVILSDPTTLRAGLTALNCALASTEALDTCAMTTAVNVSASLAATEAIDTAAMTAANVSHATLAVTEASDAAAFTVKDIVSASMAVTETQDTASAAAAVMVSAALAATEAQDTAAFAAVLIVDLNAVLDVTEAPDIVDITMEEEYQAPRGEYSEYPAQPLSWYPELYASFRTSESPDRARMSMAFDYTDDELVMSLMMAAWDDESVLSS
jgi:hypothetical protein